MWVFWFQEHFQNCQNSKQTKKEHLNFQKSKNFCKEKKEEEQK